MADSYYLSTRKEVTLEMRALKQGWLVPPDKRAAIIDRIASIAAGEEVDGNKPSPSLSIKAFNSLVLAERMTSPLRDTGPSEGRHASPESSDPVDDVLEAQVVIDQLMIDDQRPEGS